MAVKAKTSKRKCTSTTTRRRLPTRRSLQQGGTNKNTSALTPEARAARKSVLEPIITKLFNEKLKCKNHKLNKGALIETVNSYKPILDWLTVDTLKQQLTRRYDKHKKTVSKKRGDESTVRTDVSELTEDSFPPISITTATATITSSESSSIVPIPPPPGASPSDTSRNKGGRPKGSTTENAIHVKKCIAAAKNEITIA